MNWLRHLESLGRKYLSPPEVDFWQALADPDLDLQEFLGVALDQIARLFPAKGHHIYLRTKKGEFVLRATRHPGPGSLGDPVPTESGAGGDSGYRPPLTLSASDLDDTVGKVIWEGGGRMAVVPLRAKTTVGVVCLGPCRDRVPRARLARLYEAGLRIGAMLATRLEVDRLKLQLEGLSSTVSTSTSMVRQAFEGSEFMSLHLVLGAHSLQAKAGFVLAVGDEHGPARVMAVCGLDQGKAAVLGADRAFQARLLSASVGGATVSDPRGPGGMVVPHYLDPTGKGSLVVVPLEGAPGRPAGILTYMFRPGEERGVATFRVLEAIARRIEAIIKQRQVQRELRQSYLATLQDLVQVIDSLERYTVNHSALIARYAREIATELGLERSEVDRVALAAYLHDVGMFGLGDQILLKAGKYSESEVRRMQLHPELGATLVEPLEKEGLLQGLIRHHHERYDGFGYPDQLKGEAIPLGARIIAVADSLNAKLSSRQYRPALPFDEALSQLADAAGKQLDPDVVRAVLRVWEKKRVEAGRRDGPLEPCWQMKECPRSIAGGCPAYGQDRNCWEIAGTLCALHGDSCRDCQVYTEYVARRQPHPVGVRHQPYATST